MPVPGGIQFHKEPSVGARVKPWGTQQRKRFTRTLISAALRLAGYHLLRLAVVVGTSGTDTIGPRSFDNRHLQFNR